MDDLNLLFETIGLNGEDPYTLLLITTVILISTGICFFVLAGSTGYLTTILTIASCAYPVGRIKAVGMPFINESNLDELLEAGMIHDAISRIQATGYRLPIHGEPDSEKIETILEKKEIEEYQVILSSVPPDFETFFSTYTRFYEIRMLKRLLRMINNHAQRQEIIKKVISVGDITDEFIVKAGESSDVDDFMHHLRSTPYEFLTGEPARIYHQEKTLLPLEIALDRWGFEQIRHASTLIRPGLVAPFSDLVSNIIDIQNIRTLLRSKHAGLPQSLITTCLLGGGAKIPLWRLGQINEMMSLPDVVSQLNGTGYDRILQPLLQNYPGRDSLFQFDHALDQMMLITLARISGVYYFTGGPLIWFIFGKEFEYRNIRVVLLGLLEGMSPGIIKNSLTCDRGAA